MCETINLGYSVYTMRSVTVSRGNLCGIGHSGLGSNAVICSSRADAVIDHFCCAHRSSDSRCFSVCQTTPILSISLVRSGPPSNTWFLGLTQVTLPNGFSICSLVLAGLTNTRTGCLCVCLSVNPNDNIRTKWTLDWILGTVVHHVTITVSEFEGQNHSSKFEVTCGEIHRRKNIFG